VTGSVHFSSAFMAWRTPRAVFDELDAEFVFTVDGCSTDENALLDRHWTERDEPLLRSWEGERVFINPPYGRQIGRWMEKAWTEAAHALVVALVPSRTDTEWWHEHVMPADEIRFVRGRLKFGDAVNSAPFPSCIVVWGLDAINVRAAA
jgi:phage N-6-adenine-methyltransferase